MTARFFASAAAFRRWLAAHHATATEVWVGFYRKDSGRQGLTYPEAVDEALCYGWIDGVRRKIDDVSYTNRFTPRRAGSFWSAINTGRARELMASGRMAPSGARAFEARDPKQTARYSYERERSAFDPARLRRLRANAPAWRFYQAQPPSYRRPATWWVMSAKREETRERRFTTLLERWGRGERA